MRILLVTDPYPPEICSAAVLMRELAEVLSARGHEVTVLTTSPRYKLDEKDSGKTWPEFAVEGPVSVVRAPTFALHHVGYVRRGVATLLAPFQMWRCLRRQALNKFDSVFVYSPPITMGLIGVIVRRHDAGILLNVQDIFPQNAIDLGILRNPLLIALFRWIERLSYKNAHVVTAHSKGNLKLLASANPDLADKFTVLHNWIDVSAYTRRGGKDYRQLFRLEGKFIALFAGVIGPAQGLHLLVEVAYRVQDLNDFVFLIVGDGTEKRRAESLARSRGLRNIVFKSFIPPNDYPDLLSSIDLGLVCLSPEMKTPVVPGKMLGYMAASLPIAAFVNTESDIHELVAQAGCGVSAVSSDAGAMEQALRTLYGDRHLSKKMGEAGRRYVVQHFSRDHMVSEVERIMERLRASR